MGQFTTDHEALDAAVAQGDIQIADLLDGRPPPPPPPPPAPIAPPPAAAAAPAPTGPSFLTQFGNGLASIAKNITIAPAPISSQQANQATVVALEPQRTPWGLILGGVALLGLLVAVLRR